MANNFWRSRVAAFTLSSGFNADIGVSNISQPENGLLTANETVEVAIRNFGLSAQSNFPVELYLDGNLVATETFTGTINSNEALPFTFSQTLDLSNSGQTYCPTRLSVGAFSKRSRSSVASKALARGTPVPLCAHKHPQRKSLANNPRAHPAMKQPLTSIPWDRPPTIQEFDPLKPQQDATTMPDTSTHPIHHIITHSRKPHSRRSRHPQNLLSTDHSVKIC